MQTPDPVKPARTSGWRPLRLPALPEKIRPRLLLAREVLTFAALKARQARLEQVAASLTYSTVLALVPLLAVALAAFAALPSFNEYRDAVERSLLRGLLPEPFAGTILRYLSEFAAKATRVGALGLAFFALTALTMILTVDRVLNDIWQVHQRRALTQRVLLYWTLLTIGPLLIGASLALTSYVLSVSPGAQSPGMLHELLALASPALGTLAYCALYAFVPNRRVLWLDALVGGLVAALVDEGLSRGFAAFITHGSLLTIYGAFAVVPIFLIWIYLSWLSFLFGAAIAATLPQLRSVRFVDHYRRGNRFVTAVALLRLLVSAQKGAGPPERSTPTLARAVGGYEEDVAALLSELERLGYVRQLARGSAGSAFWILGCDPARANLGAAFDHFAIDPANSLLKRPDLDLLAWLAPGLQGDWLRTPLAALGVAGRAQPVQPAPAC
jgi:membrane protein